MILRLSILGGEFTTVSINLHATKKGMYNWVVKIHKKGSVTLIIDGSMHLCTKNYLDNLFHC